MHEIPYQDNGREKKKRQREVVVVWWWQWEVSVRAESEGVRMPQIIQPKWL